MRKSRTMTEMGDINSDSDRCEDDDMLEMLRVINEDEIIASLKEQGSRDRHNLIILNGNHMHDIRKIIDKIIRLMREETDVHLIELVDKIIDVTEYHHRGNRSMIDDSAIYIKQQKTIATTAEAIVAICATDNPILACARDILAHC